LFARERLLELLDDFQSHLSALHQFTARAARAGPARIRP
jgi:hypothetical protein